MVMKRCELGSMPAPLLLLLSLVLGNTVGNVKSTSLTKPQQRRAAIERLKEIIPPPGRRELGGEAADDEAYARFLSVDGWDPQRAAPKFRESMEWRKRVRPGALRPRDCSTLSGQRAWVALTSGSDLLALDDGGEVGDGDGPGRLPPDVPHNCPPLQTWRTTRHGLPITYFRCWNWRPDKASAGEIERHTAYHMHHLIRRMGRNVTRICIIFDMRGFEAWMLPYIHQMIKVLRLHYPGRAGAMCLINVPVYFHTAWKIISPWLDDEIRSKTFFAPKEADDVEKVIGFLNKMNLKSGPV